MAATRDTQATGAKAAHGSGAVSVFTGSEDRFDDIIGKPNHVWRRAVALPIGEGVTR
jgi:hypothetical protein